MTLPASVIDMSRVGPNTAAGFGAQQRIARTGGRPRQGGTMQETLRKPAAAAPSSTVADVVARGRAAMALYGAEIARHGQPRIDEGVDRMAGPA